MKFAVYFRASKRVSFMTENEKLAIAHLLLLDGEGQRIYDYQSIKDDDYEVPTIR